jgi:hypothetical protein
VPRAIGQRRWIKLYPIECLEGSIRYQLEADERGVWYDLLNYAAICSEPGVISDRDGRPYPHSFIANRLNVSIELFERSLRKCADEGRIRENDDGIHIVNWKVYQSEYDRQKPYRQAKKLRERDYTHLSSCSNPECNWSSPVWGRGAPTECPECGSRIQLGPKGE